jgi:hypothetical protein
MKVWEWTKNNSGWIAFALFALLAVGNFITGEWLWALGDIATGAFFVWLYQFGPFRSRRKHATGGVLPPPPAPEPDEVSFIVPVGYIPPPQADDDPVVNHIRNCKICKDAGVRE